MCSETIKGIQEVFVLHQLAILLPASLLNMQKDELSVHIQTCIILSRPLITRGSMVVGRTEVVEWRGTSTQHHMEPAKGHLEQGSHGDIKIL